MRTAFLWFSLMVLAIPGFCQGVVQQQPKKNVAPRPTRPSSDSPGSFNVHSSSGTASGFNASSLPHRTGKSASLSLQAKK